MDNKKIEFRYFKTERDFVTSLLFIQHYFGPDATNILSNDFLFNDYAERDKIIQLYKKENEDYQKHLRRMKFVPKAIQDALVPAKLAYGEEYKVMVALMDINNKDTLHFYDIQDAINNSKYLFDTYFDVKLADQAEME